ncbi:MAG: helix-turn-helix domain-containing protein [candidate division WOR-3 bacterium]
MRRTEKEIKKLRLKIIELKKEGKSYEEIRRKTGASPNTIAKVLKGFSGRYCINCGETNPDVLHEHHPDKENRPDYTITLCANCHNEIHRSKEKKGKDIEQKTDVILQPQNNPISVLPEVVRSKQIQIIQQVNFQPLSWEEVKSIFFGISGTIGIVEGLFNKEMKPLERFTTFTAGLFLLIKSIKIFVKR